MLVVGSPARANCVGGPTIFNCSGADNAGTITYTTTPAPTYHLTGEAITGAGGNGITVQTTDANPANTAVVTMDASSSITLSGVNLFRGLLLQTNGAGISVMASGPITTVGGNSILAQVNLASTAPVSIMTFAGGAMTGRITGFTTGSGSVTITTGDTVSLAAGAGGTEGTSAIDADSLGGGHVTVQANAAVHSIIDGIQGVTFNGGQIDITTGAGGSVNATRLGIVAEAQLGTAAVNITTNAPVLTNGNTNLGTPFAIFATSDGGNVNVTTNATVGDFGIRAFTGVGAFTTGNVAITANANVTGNGAAGAFNLSTIDGQITLNVNNGAVVATANAAGDAVHAVTTGLGGVAINLAAGTVMSSTGGGIFIDQSAGTGSTVINTAASISGAGSAAKPVISIATNGTATLNNTGSIFSLAGSPADLAIKEAGGSFTINNGGSLTGRVTAGDTTFNNQNTWAVFGTNTFGAATINNSGTLTVAGVAGNAASVTDFTASGQLTVSNTGSLIVNGAANFTGAAGSAFTNAGGIIDMRQGVIGDVVTVRGNFNGGANSRLGVDTFLGGVGSRSDQLFVTGNVTGSTSIIVHDTNPGPGGFTGPGGIPIVTVGGNSTPANFSLSPASTVIGGGFLPINGGVLRKGLFDYMLIDDPAVFALVSVPNTALFQMPVALTATQTIWYETAFAWEDRQLEVRDFFHRGVAPPTVAERSALPVKALPLAPAAPTEQPGIWMKAVGSWTNRSDTQSFAIAGTTLPIDLGYKQNVYGAIGGIDFGREAMLTRSDAVVLGLMGGYVNSGLDFGSSATTFRFSGGTAGASATYLNNGFFADTLAKVDFLRLDIAGLPVGAGAPSAGADAQTFGVIGNLGYRVEWQRLFVEPLATLAYTRTRIGDIGLPVAGVIVNFVDAETVRGALGARFGARVVDGAGWGLDASIVARAWDQFRGNNGANIANTGLPLLLTDNFTGTFGEVTGHLDLVRRGTGFSAFVAGGAKFNHDFITTNAKAGIRFQF
jgi:hypothetical protein